MTIARAVAFLSVLILAPARAAGQGSPSTAADWVLSAKKKCTTRDWSGCSADAENAIRLDPDNLDGYMYRAFGRHHRGDFDGAIADWDRVLELEAKSGADSAPTFLVRAEVLADKGDLAGASADCEKVSASTASGENAARRAQCDQIVERARSRLSSAGKGSAAQEARSAKAHLASGDFDAAIADAGRAIEAQPDFAQAYVLRAMAKKRAGDAAGALADYSKAIEVKPDYALAYFNRGVAKRDGGDAMGAATDLSKAIELQPGDADAYYERGLSWPAGETGLKKADFEKVLELKPGHEGARAALARLGGSAKTQRAAREAAASPAPEAPRRKAGSPPQVLGLAEGVWKHLQGTREYADLTALYQQKKSDAAWTKSEAGVRVRNLLEQMRRDAFETKIVRSESGSPQFVYQVGGSRVTDTGILLSDLKSDKDYRDFIENSVAANIATNKMHPVVAAELAAFEAARKK